MRWSRIVKLWSCPVWMNDLRSGLHVLQHQPSFSWQANYFPSYNWSQAWYWAMRSNKSDAILRYDCAEAVRNIKWVMAWKSSAGMVKRRYPGSFDPGILAGQLHRWSLLSFSVMIRHEIADTRWDLRRVSPWMQLTKPHSWLLRVDPCHLPFPSSHASVDELFTDHCDEPTVVVPPRSECSRPNVLDSSA
jgi:hypothetical protein